MIGKTLEIRNTLKSLELMIAQAKADFESFITDKNIPLWRRWWVFEEACEKQDYLGNHHDWFVELETCDVSEFYRDEPGECTGRGRRFTTAEFVRDKIEEPRASLKSLQSKEILDEWKSSWKKNLEQMDLIDIDVKAIKEEILSENLMSFCYDW